MGTVAVNVTGRPRRLSYSAIVDMYREGETSPQIARRLGADHTSVLYALKRSGVDTSAAARRARAVTRSQAVTDRDERVRRLYMEESLTERQVALRLNISRTAVRNSIIRMNLKLRTMSEAAKIREVSAAHIRAMSKELAAQRAERKRLDDARVARMMEIVNRRPMRLSL